MLNKHSMFTTTIGRAGGEEGEERGRQHYNIPFKYSGKKLEVLIALRDYSTGANQ